MASQKVFRFVRGLKQNQIPLKNYHFQLAKDSENLTGFEHNAVCMLMRGQREKEKRGGEIYSFFFFFSPPNKIYIISNNYSIGPVGMKTPIPIIVSDKMLAVDLPKCIQLNNYIT